jgi:hypothetical protein
MAVLAAKHDQAVAETAEQVVTEHAELLERLA